MNNSRFRKPELSAGLPVRRFGPPFDSPPASVRAVRTLDFLLHLNRTTFFLASMNHVGQHSQSM